MVGPVPAGRRQPALAAYVRATVTTQFHPCGTARMGPSNDAMAVVDQHCRVRSIPNLRVVDASVMSAVPPANINLTCIMIGEHVADWMRGEPQMHNTHKWQIWPQEND